jgi:hypothetical protein
MAIQVVKSPFGIPVVDSPNGLPAEENAKGFGQPVQVVDNGYGLPLNLSGSGPTPPPGFSFLSLGPTDTLTLGSDNLMMAS